MFMQFINIAIFNAHDFIYSNILQVGNVMTQGCFLDLVTSMQSAYICVGSSKDVSLRKCQAPISTERVAVKPADIARGQCYVAHDSPLQIDQNIQKASTNKNQPYHKQLRAIN